MRLVLQNWARRMRALVFFSLVACNVEPDDVFPNPKAPPLITVDTKAIEHDVSVTIIKGFVRSYGVGVDEEGNIYVPDMPAHNIVKFSPHISIITFLCYFWICD